MNTTKAVAALYGQSKDFGFLYALAPYCRHKLFIDVGAERGGFASPLLEAGFSGVLIEPLQRHVAVLQAFTQQFDAQLLPIALDASDREAILHIATDEQGKELDHFHSLQRASSPLFSHTQTVTITCRSLDSLVAEKTIPAAVGIVKIDTEGNDLNVLKGMETLQAEVIMCEFFSPRRYPGWESARAEQLIAQAKQLGFSQYIALKRAGLVEIVSLNSPVFSEEQWGNIIFIADAIFDAAKPQIMQWICESEEALARQCASLQQACEEKERVIQDLVKKKPFKIC